MFKQLSFVLVLLLSYFMPLFAEDHKDKIEGPITTPQQVTEQCLACHEEIGTDIMKTQHWTWLSEPFQAPGNGAIQMGKQNIVNNFCIAVPSNWPRCTSCHISYGWKDTSFDLNDPSNIDCLICHDQTGTYKKVATGAGMPAENIDLLKVAQSVGKTTRQNCGTCHFDGGGGDGVKHGDLDASLLKPTKNLDVHMGGNDYTCTECHRTEEHLVLGASHASMAKNANHVSCTDCHETAPHQKEKLNNHTNAVSCQTCHIPEYGRGNATKIWWDWSSAGKDIVPAKDEFGKELYDKKKGDFKWAKNVRPSYLWYNGQATYYQFGDKINTQKPVALNKLTGKISDANSKIYPFKVMRGKQIYDQVNNYLIIPKLFGEKGYWKDWDWNVAAREGMTAVNLAYSGQFDFVETEMYIPIHHMVAPKEQSLKCYNCHHKSKSILDWKSLGYSDDPMGKSVKKKQNYVR
ncbi:MAG: tetrathionate reductase family octaheme c-type cytochrome [Candidatus Zhuqueibacterota bacterium]